MKGLSRHGQPPILAPVESPRLGGEVDEYRLVGEPTCLHEIFDFLRGNKRVIWISPHAYVAGSVIVVPTNFDVKACKVWFKKYKKKGTESVGSEFLRILGKTHSDKLGCFEVLIGLPDTQYTGIEISSNSPLTPRVLKILLNRNQGTGRYTFQRQLFSVECGSLLATWGSGTHLTFSFDCRFEDGGEAFVKALLQRQDDREGPSAVTMDPNKLFDGVYRYKFLDALQETPLQNFSLVLLYGTMLDQHASGLLALATIRMLSLKGAQMADGGEALTAAIGGGHGPRGLHILYSPEIFISAILNAVGDEKCSVEKLIIIMPGTGNDGLLTPALHGNKSLCHFELHCWCSMNIQVWNQMLRAIRNHPKLQTLIFSDVTTGGVQESERRQRTEDIAGLLKTNHRLSDVTFCATTFDRAKWDDRVAPFLECNRWRRNVCRLWRIEPESTRASLLAMCLARVSSNPSTVNMLLSSNQGVIASYRAH